MTTTNIQVIEMQGVRVLTTAQLAESYGTDTNTITQNFKRNKNRYEEGKHYVCLKGEDLRAFKSEMTNCHFAKNLNVLYLWTERGALLHAKSLNTDTAWEVYDRLVETYFRAKKAQAALNELSPQLQFMIRMETEQNALKAKVADIEQRLDSMTAEPEPEPPKALPKKWSEREKDYLRKAYALGQTDTEIAADLGRTVDSIKNKRRVLGLCGNRCSKWSTDEDKKLVKLYNKGLTYNEIGKLIGRSYEAVNSRLGRLRIKGKV
ncbi:MAG: ORF6N domain-containing protein [Ruminiclostridium sp.]|nr:ORF6N domain-containing protein [Clostridia bacterium]MBQ9385015.1 ORF6N domain-containing protein [Ruminiclostridium sp.]